MRQVLVSKLYELTKAHKNLNTSYAINYSDFSLEDQNLNNTLTQNIILAFIY